MYYFDDVLSEENAIEDEYVLHWIRTSSIEPQPATFLLPGIPDDNITVVAGDGGVGKSLFECNIAAAISTGKASILDQTNEIQREPGSVLLLNAEDSVSRIVIKRLKNAGANMNNILVLDDTDPTTRSYAKVDSEALQKSIRIHRPKLLIIDPLQAYLDKQDMNSRNDMRNALAPLQVTAEKYHCAIVIIMHTNKRFKSYGRDRLAGSADLWDIARSVFIMGNTRDENKTRYLSHEKNSYGDTVSTKLLGINSSGLYLIGETDRKDYDFIMERDKQPGGRPPIDRDDAKTVILETLKKVGGEMDGELMRIIAEENDISRATFARARSDLINTAIIEKRIAGLGENRRTFYRLKT